MSEKRKDNKGRILKDGESQRKNGSYMYRYNDIHENRQYIYAPTLEELRQKEKSIRRDLDDGIDYAAGNITVSELVARYIGMRRGLSRNSQRAYHSAINRIDESDFGKRRVNTVKLSDAKIWFVSLHDGGVKQNTISVIQSVVRPAFEMAVEDDIIRKNPFKFKLADIVPNDATTRDALIKTQQERYLQFVREHGHDRYYDDIVVLLGTGLRVSELYGLTKTDIDLSKRCIMVERQLCRTAETPYFITSPKTKSGIRIVPMTDTVYETIKRILKKRESVKVEMLVDGYGGFLFLDKNDRPKVAMHLENHMRGLQRKYTKLHGNTLPKVTPHVLRHTFCTNAQQAGLDVKSLQYLMGHSHASETLDVYTHTDYDAVQKAFGKIAVAM